MIIAIKGYIGTGKSTVSKIIANTYGYKYINADEVVANLYEDKNIQEDVCSILDLDFFSKKEIGNIVFKNIDKLNNLEAYIHPKLEKKLNDFILENKNNVVIDCQVIDKLNVIHDFEILCVCSKDTILNRIKNRDRRETDEIESILKIQEQFIVQHSKVLPINTNLDEDGIKEQIDKVLSTFEKFSKKNLYEDDFDD